MRARIDELERAGSEPVAVIGIGCRLPGGASGPDGYWHLLREGVDAITEVPPDRWDVDTYYDPDPDAPGKVATRWGGFLERVDEFDADFFGITAREAVSMDPQQRLLLEVAWEALEDAAQPPKGLRGSRTGVFVGIGTNDYTDLRLMHGDPRDVDAYLAMGSSHSVASGRLSYVLGLQGPSVSLDTACSSSLVATHLAVRSLQGGECDLALVGGVNLMLLPEMVMTLSRAHMMAADGRCKAFDARADGFVRAEGCGVVVLKRLSDALGNADHVRAVIRGTAINSDGRAQGLTAPNGLAQEGVLRAALASAHAEPGDVDYVEAHGTGTALGDPIEVGALGAVLGAGRPRKKPLLIGSAKTNLGHLEAAAGVTGLIKTVLALEHEEIPPHLHLTERNPFIPWDELPVEVPTRRTAWPRGQRPRLAGVSSFGFSGTNAHAVLEEPPAPAPAAPVADRPRHLLTLSARSADALDALSRRWSDRLGHEPRLPVADVCFTANAGRSHLPHRLAVAGAAAAELRGALERAANGRDPACRGQALTAAPPRVAFLFPGQGCQYPGMGRELFDTEPVFRSILERCDEFLRGRLERPLLSVIYPDDDGASGALDDTVYTQPAVFAVQAALAELWRSFGIEPAVVAGHSLGEYAAAYVAGVFTLEEALGLVAIRGRLTGALTDDGAMAVVMADAQLARAVAEDAGLAVAAVNGPNNTVLSGRGEAVEAAVQRLAADGVETRVLRVSHAAHSPLMEPMLDELERAAQAVAFTPPAIPLVSCLTGALAPGATVCSPAYWRRHTRETVRFADAVRAVAGDHPHVFLEMGPRPTLLGMAREALGTGAADHAWLPALRPGVGDWTQLLDSLAACYLRGADIDWAAFDRPHDRRRLPLPTYPFQRRSYWLVEASSRPVAPAADPDAVWQAALTAGHREAERGPLDLSIDEHAQQATSLHRLATAAIVEALGDLGAFGGAAEEHTVDGLVADLDVPTVHRRLVTRWLETLAEEGLLERRETGRYASPQPLPPMPLAPLAAEARRRFPRATQLFDYVQRSGERLAALLRGQESPLEALFPGGSMATASYLYETAPMVRYANGIAAGVLEAAVRAGGSRPLRVLEVGAGTGGTTSALLPLLPAERTTYVYTDLSDFFFARAENRFGKYPFVRFAVLDIERDPGDQSFERHGYDVVVAANVLHATRSLHQTVDHVRSLLDSGGLLLLYETTHHPTWFDVTIGLIDGWSRFDDDLRTTHPLLSATEWVDLLTGHGFEAAAAWPSESSPAETLGVHVLAARAPRLSAASARDDTADVAPMPGAAPGQRDDGGVGVTEQPPAIDLSRRLVDAPPRERQEILVAEVRRHVMAVTRSDSTRAIDRRERLMDVGVDSLMAVELAERLRSALALSDPLPATLVFDYPTIEAIAGHLSAHVTGPADNANGSAGDDGPAARPPSVVTASAEVASLSDADVEQLLLAKLERQQGAAE